jgi:hypothetical protein
MLSIAALAICALLLPLLIQKYFHGMLIPMGVPSPQMQDDINSFTIDHSAAVFHFSRCANNF